MCATAPNTTRTPSRESIREVRTLESDTDIELYREDTWRRWLSHRMYSPPLISPVLIPSP
jgi:hypothetical protein